MSSSSIAEDILAVVLAVVVAGMFGIVGYLVTHVLSRARIIVGRPLEYPVDWTGSYRKGVKGKIIRVHVQLKRVQRSEVRAYLLVDPEINPETPRVLYWADQHLGDESGHKLKTHEFDSPTEAVNHAFKFHFSNAGPWTETAGFLDIAANFEGIEGFYLPIATNDVEGQAHIKKPGKYRVPVELRVEGLGSVRKDIYVTCKMGGGLSDLQIDNPSITKKLSLTFSILFRRLKGVLFSSMTESKLKENTPESKG